jgi:hypothetical protein
LSGEGWGAPGGGGLAQDAAAIAAAPKGWSVTVHIPPASGMDPPVPLLVAVVAVAVVVVTLVDAGPAPVPAPPLVPVVAVLPVAPP